MSKPGMVVRRHL